mmetsp:Transcript_102276/g.292758  ORF Transcript_102276/g.292758 Transcript_102276/m.292758 type:complete len:227 (+) Transcript_102276:2922-3602(+)
MRWWLGSASRKYCMQTCANCLRETTPPADWSSLAKSARRSGRGCLPLRSRKASKIAASTSAIARATTLPGCPTTPGSACRSTPAISSKGMLASGVSTINVGAAGRMGSSTSASKRSPAMLPRPAPSTLERDMWRSIRDVSAFIVTLTPMSSAIAPASPAPSVGAMPEAPPKPWSPRSRDSAMSLTRSSKSLRARMACSYSGSSTSVSRRRSNGESAPSGELAGAPS